MKARQSVSQSVSGGVQLAAGKLPLLSSDWSKVKKPSGDSGVGNGNGVGGGKGRAIIKYVCRHDDERAQL